MSLGERTFLLLYGLIVATWVFRHVLITFIYRKLDVLTRESPAFDQTEAPLVSAIVPARDEERDLPVCLADVRAQSYRNLEIIVADDRSTDRTGEIARSIAESDPRVRVVSITEVPDGWTGKTHALHVAAARARGDWLWFVDADTEHTLRSLAIMMEYARAHNAALVSLLPRSRCDTFWEKVLQPLEGIVLMRSYPLFDVNRDDRAIAFANGQYVLVRRDVYEAVGGHAAVRSWFVEDIHLARLVKKAGHRVRCAVTTEISATRMYSSLAGLVRGWARILYDGLDRRPLVIVGKIVEPLVFSQSGDIALLAALTLLVFGVGGPFAWWLLGLSLVHQLLKQTVLVRMYAWSAPATAHYAWLYPLAGVVSAWISLQALALCFTGKVRWRGTEYASGQPPRPA